MRFWNESISCVPYADRSIGCGVELAAACASDIVDLGFQSHPRGQPSTVKDKVLFQRSVWQHAKSNADTDVLWEGLAARFLVVFDVAVDLCRSSRRLTFEAEVQELLQLCWRRTRQLTTSPWRSSTGDLTT